MGVMMWVLEVVEACPLEAVEEEEGLPWSCNDAVV